MSHLPPLKPVVLITSRPGGSSSQKRTSREGPSSSAKRKRLGQNTGVPSARVEVLLPPIGSWKHRLFRNVDHAPRDAHVPSLHARAHGETLYTVTDDELMESADFLPGETPPDPDDPCDEEDIPVRMLDDFAIYDWDTLRLIPIAELLHLKRGLRYGASGSVSAWTDEGTDEDSSVDESEASTLSQILRLSPILELNVHHFSPESNGLDPKIYLKTKFAWYILDAPARLYRPYFLDFWLKHRVLHLLVTSALANPSVTLSRFLHSPEVKGDVPIMHAMLRRPLSTADILSEDTRAYVQDVLLDLSDDGLKLAHVPLVRQLLKTDIYSGSAATQASSRQTEKTTRSRRTVVTLEVHALSAAMFQQSFKVVQPYSLRGLQSYTCPLDLGEIHDASPIIKWIGDPISKSIYGAVRIGKTVYKPGEVVIVLPGEDPDKIRQSNARASSSQSLNNLAEYWFVRIFYLFEREGQQYLHGQWLSHGSKTLLQEAAHPNSLFLMDCCDDVPLDSIIQKCNLHWLAQDEKEPKEDATNRFYCNGMTWNEDLGAFIDAAKVSSHLMASCPCTICVSQQAKKESETPTLGLGSFSYLGITYHEQDFVYVLNNQDYDAPYTIAQVLSFGTKHSTVQVQVRQLEHYGDLIAPDLRASDWKRDYCHLYFTLKTESISAENVMGKCYVQHPSTINDLEAWLSHMDHFYVQNYSTRPPFIRVDALHELQLMDSSALSYCEECYQEHITMLAKKEEGKKPLKALELFAGAGGLSIGLEESQVVKTKWAIEYAPSAARTFKYNKQHTKVYNQDCNLLLDHAIQVYNGKNLAPLQSLEDGEPLEPLPKPGKVDLICGGPPCQGFSGANRHPQPDDPRNSLVCNMLSYVEFYQPKFFLLENVLGLLNHKLQVNKAGPQKGNTVIHGVVKFILRALTSLGYQVRFSVLQAGAYGSPQNRRRIIFWGARRGLPLPEFPIPTHTFVTTQWTVQLDTGLKLEPVGRDPDKPHRGAPLRAVTVDDAISDLVSFDHLSGLVRLSSQSTIAYLDTRHRGWPLTLQPKFDWKNPHAVIEATREARAEMKRRAAVAIPAFEAVSTRAMWEQDDDDPFSGYPDGVPYASVPRTRYQARARQGIADDADVELHYTARFSQLVVERVCNIAIRAGADWSSLPRQLALEKKDREERSSSQRDVRYSRVDANGHFRTAMTTVTPNSQGATVVHPTQKRVLSVRECARAQGFPDSWKFLSVSDRPSTIVRDQLRQIGNAVPVPLSRALGRALGDALMKMWEAEAEAEARDSGSLAL